MTAKTLMLAEIRAALDAHSAAVDNFIQWARKHEGDTLQVNDLSQVDAAEKQIKDNAIDYLKALLPVVEAAQKIENHGYVFRHASEIDGDCTCGICGGNWSSIDCPQHEDDCYVKQFLDALAKLEGN